MTLIVALLVVGVIIFMFLLVVSRGFSFPWFRFLVKGKESGFTYNEINLLRDVAIENKLKNPTHLFWSVKVLDRCIRSAIIGFRARGTQDHRSNLEYLNRLFDFRARVELNQPQYRLGLKSTRSIGPGQALKIVLGGNGVYQSRVIENNRRYLAIAYPQGNRLPPGFKWTKQTLKTYFWRKGDAGYYFEGNVIGDFLVEKVPILHVAHTEKLVRNQKRKSVRRSVGTNGVIFPLRSISRANEDIETAGGGLRCKVIDISETGMGVAIGGKAKAGIPLKMQVTIAGEIIIMCGIVRSVEYKTARNLSVLHIEAKRPSLSMRAKILSFVYGLFASEHRADEAHHAPPPPQSEAIAT